MFNNLIDRNELVQHLFKAPGDNISGLEYPEEDLLLWFSFTNQFNVLKENKIIYILGDTKFSTNKLNYKLCMFSTLGVDELNIPFLFIITSTEESSVLSQCLKGFKNSCDFFSDLEPKILMTDMANNFNIAIKSIFKNKYIYLWCAYHFKNAFTKKLLEVIKNKEQRDNISTEF